MNQPATAALDHVRLLHFHGRLAEAALACDDLLDRHPRHEQALRVGALLHTEAGHAERAADLLVRLIKIVPKDEETLYQLGVVLNGRGAHEDSIRYYRRLLRINPRHVPGLANLGASLLVLDRFEEAEDCLQRALSLDPGHLMAATNLAVLANQKRDYTRAAERARAVLARHPGSEEALMALGMACWYLRDLPAAIEAYTHALAVASRPLRALTSRAGCFRELARFDEARADIARALEIAPADPRALCEAGNLDVDEGRFAEAEARYRAALAADPSWSAGAFSLGVLLLLQGRYTEGWPFYEHRKWAPNPVGNREYPCPKLDTVSDAPGRTVLVHAEQGLGDTIQFGRYLPLLAAAGATVLFAPQPQLAWLFRSLAGFNVVDRDKPGRRFDRHVPLLDLPRLFATDTSSIPAPLTGLAAEPARVEAWQRRIGHAGFRIGVCWQGSLSPIDAGRSFPLRELAPLARIPGVRLLSLHRGGGEAQVATCGFNVEVLGPDFDGSSDAFRDSAAVMKCVDLVVSSDTAVAHLAGTLGVPVWVALKAGPDWRWGLGRDDTPWYPSVRLFRQGEPAQWADVFAKMARAVSALIADRGLGGTQG